MSGEVRLPKLVRTPAGRRTRAGGGSGGWNAQPAQCKHCAQVLVVFGGTAGGQDEISVRTHLLLPTCVRISFVPTPLPTIAPQRGPRCPRSSMTYQANRRASCGRVPTALRGLSLLPRGGCPYCPEGAVPTAPKGLSLLPRGGCPYCPEGAVPTAPPAAPYCPGERFPIAPPHHDNRYPPPPRV